MIRFLLFFSLSLLLACQSKQKLITATDKNKKELGPKLTKPVVKKVWVRPKIEDDGRTYRDGHFIYLLDKDVTWSK